MIFKKYKELQEENKILREALSKYDALSAVDIVREKMKGLRLNFAEALISKNEQYVYKGVDDYAKTNSEKQDIYSKAHLIDSNDIFHRVVKHLINQQGNYSLRESINFEQDLFGRATINGLMLIEEEIARLSSIHREIIKQEETYDKHDLI